MDPCTLSLLGDPPEPWGTPGEKGRADMAGAGLLKSRIMVMGWGRGSGPCPTGRGREIRGSGTFGGHCGRSDDVDTSRVQGLGSPGALEALWLLSS